MVEEKTDSGEKTVNLFELQTNLGKVTLKEMSRDEELKASKKAGLRAKAGGEIEGDPQLFQDYQVLYSIDTAEFEKTLENVRKLNKKFYSEILKRIEKINSLDGEEEKKS